MNDEIASKKKTESRLSNEGLDHLHSISNNVTMIP